MNREPNGSGGVGKREEVLTEGSEMSSQEFIDTARALVAGDKYPATHETCGITKTERP
jgi:hypothetical protein